MADLGQREQISPLNLIKGNKGDGNRWHDA